jgi:hypothetical protein
MFDGSLPEPAALSEVDDAVLVGAIAGWARAEAAAAARRLAAIAELVGRRCGDEDGDRWHWACDYWDAAAAEISAAQHVSHGKASGDMHTAWTLRTRLPQVGALFAAGQLNPKVVTAIVSRTDLVADGPIMALLDTEIAARAATWGPLSVYKTEQAIDLLVDAHDPGARRRTRDSVASRDVQIGGRNDPAGTSSVWGRLYATDATLLHRRLTAMAHAVCDEDPRTAAQRRADALGALAAGADHLACRCGGPACPAGGDDARASQVVVHIVTDTTAVQEQPAPAEPATRPAVSRPTAGVILGGSIVPAPLLAELIRTGAHVRYVSAPGEAAQPRYRPSTALDEFVRIRDLTCRFPGCDRPAHYCDLDHTIAWPHGPTHPANLKPYCRIHHLVKTFWTGEDGWTDRQLPDGTLTWTAPSGLTYTTRPGSTLLFPDWNTTTTPLPPPASGPTAPSNHRGQMMPKRKRTRTQQRTARIKAERALNDTHATEHNIPPPF